MKSSRTICYFICNLFEAIVHWIFVDRKYENKNNGVSARIVEHGKPNFYPFNVFSTSLVIVPCDFFLYFVRNCRYNIHRSSSVSRELRSV